MSIAQSLPPQSNMPLTTHHPGWRLTLARITWGITLPLVAFATFFSTVQYVNLWINGQPLPFDWWNLNGLPTTIFYPLDFMINGIIFWVYFIIAFYFGWKRFDDWMILIASTLWLTLAYVYGSSIHRVIPLDTALYFMIDSISISTALIFVGTFPNGRFVPRWIRPLFFALILLALIDNILRSQTGNGVMHSTIRTLIYGTTLLFAPIYRLKKADDVEQQQMKLATLAITLNIMAYAIRHLVPVDGQLSWLLKRLTIDTLLIVSAAALIFALIQYRLWDVDFAINRSIVYGGLTLLLGAIFTGLFFGLRVLTETLFGNSQDTVLLVLSTAVVVALFTPARNKMRRFVDKYLYGIDLDYEKEIKAQAFRRKQIVDKANRQTSFGSYNGLELIGRGGMGEVYRACHATTKQCVAIKILPEQFTNGEEARQRFIREAETISQLKHPNIITMREFGEEDGRPYMIMDYLDGMDIHGMLKKNGRFSPITALPYLQEIAAALDYAHAQGVIHRDIKPSNIIIANGETGHKHAVLMDFGIAKVYAATTRITQTGMVGTLDYIAPEQIQGAKDVSPSADIYSFGIMTYEMLTGQLPFIHNNMGAMVMAHLMQPPPDPQQIVPDIPFNAAHAIVTAMAKKPENRFETAHEFIDTIAASLPLPA